MDVPPHVHGANRLRGEMSSERRNVYWRMAHGAKRPYMGRKIYKPYNTTVFVFHQDSEPANRARDTVELLSCESERSQFISPEYRPIHVPANSRDLNPIDYCLWGMNE